MTRLPYSLSISMRSVISLTTMAVLLMANAPDSARVDCQLIAHKPGASQAKPRLRTVLTSMVSRTCSRPRPKT